MSLLVLADHHDGQLAGATAHVVAAARKIAGDTNADIDLLVAGDNVQAIAEAGAKLDGVSRVRVADNAVYAHQLAEPLADLLAALADDYSQLVRGKLTMEQIKASKVA